MGLAEKWLACRHVRFVNVGKVQVGQPPMVRCVDCGQPGERVTIPAGLRLCYRCGELKPEGEFHWQVRGERRDSRCRECRNRYTHDYAVAVG